MFGLKSLSISNNIPSKLFTALAAIIAGVLCMSCSSNGGEIRKFSDYSVYNIRPLRPDAETDQYWAEFLFNHMNRRADDHDLVRLNDDIKSKSTLYVNLSLDPELEYEYEITVKDNNVTLAGRHKATMLWLAYQFMTTVGNDDHRIHTFDLQPSMIDIKTQKSNFAFEYRGIYSAANMNSDQMLMIASQNVDSDWGLWGHNLSKLFPGGLPNDVMALVNGHRTSEQLCMSSPLLYDAIVKHVRDNYGDTEDDFARFLIMPNDNELVCQCDRCVEQGNTPDNNTPAVANLITQLCARFPYHQFFMAAYLTTNTIPYYPGPPNAGVFVSAIDLPMKAHPEENARFVDLINQWKTVTDRVFVWDYLRNFDDYLTPYPQMNLMNERIDLYKQLGVRGVFINGSAPMYATFNYMNTFVMAALLINPDLDTNELIHRFFVHYYPTTYTVIEPYYQTMEKAAVNSGKTLPFYGGVNDITDTYLEPEKFHEWYSEIEQAARPVEGIERYHVHRLLTGLSFCGLELLRLSDAMYSSPLVNKYLVSLNDYHAYPNMIGYREADGDISAYINQWQNLPTISAPFRANGIKGMKIKPLSPLDEGYDNTAMLTDGLCGFTTDYHVNWLINSGRVWSLEIPAGAASRGQMLTVSTLSNPRWHLQAPARIEIWQGGRQIGVSHPEAVGKNERSMARVNLAGASSSLPIELKIYPREGAKVAVDEIMIN